MCHKRVSTETSDHRVQKAADFLIKTLNNLVKDFDICMTWKLKSIEWALISHLNEENSHENDRKLHEILLKVKVEPGKKTE